MPHFFSVLTDNEMIQLSKHIFIETVSYEQQAFVFVLYLFQKPLANFLPCRESVTQCFKLP